MRDKAEVAKVLTELFGNKPKPPVSDLLKKDKERWEALFAKPINKWQPPKK